MGLLRELKEKYKTVSIVGMAKNAGKTTALNFLIEEAMDEGLVLGITSTGRDGESRDLVSGTDKPRVFLDEGTIVSVPVNLYELSDAGLEILKITDYRTTLGNILLCRVAGSGFVQIAGPTATAESRKMCVEMEAMGAELIIIDGAIDRKSIASPESSDAVILSTGAVISRSLRKVVEETAYVVGLYGTAALDDGTVRNHIEEKKYLEKILLFSGKGKGIAKTLSLKTGLNGGKYLDDAIADDTEYVYIPGALTVTMIDSISTSKLNKVTFIVKDPTKIFIDVASWQKLTKKGLRLNVLENIKVAAVTVNPHAPAGYAFDHRELLEAMRNAVKGIPILDVNA